MTDTLESEAIANSMKKIPEHHLEILLELMERRTSAKSRLKDLQDDLSHLEGKINEAEDEIKNYDESVLAYLAGIYNKVPEDVFKYVSLGLYTVEKVWSNYDCSFDTDVKL